MHVDLSRFIEGDLGEIGIYIARDNPRRAKTFVEQLRSAAAAIGRKPEIHPLRPDLGRDVRVCREGQYLILFRILDGYVRIDRIVHEARDLSKLQLE
jgi:toxin ParE1/3/4